MRHALSLLCLLNAALFTANATAQPAAKAPAKPAATAPETASTIHQLPVRQVVLYKNGIGYFEHLGSVSGNQRVAIDFTSSQLNDVLQSLTVLDDNGGRIGGVNYNSTTPLAEQLKSLSLAMSDDPTSTELFQALRGQRVEVTGAPGGNITGRLMSVESRALPSGPAETDTDTARPAQTRFYLTLIAANSAVRVIELTPGLSVRPLDANLQGQLDRYLELLSSAHSTGLRHLTLDALGTGPRQLHVSYISEVPVWKSTYRIVFPRDATDHAILQGWAVVDNTIGSDWDNVQLSLVAGAPQSFIQPLSQPLYLRRPEVAISTTAMTTPQTHESGEESSAGTISGTVTDTSGAVVSGATVTLTPVSGGSNSVLRTSLDGGFTFQSLNPGQYNLTVTSNGFQTYAMRGINVSSASSPTLDVRLNVGSASETVEVTADALAVMPMASAPKRATRGYNMAAMQGMSSGAAGGVIGGVFGGAGGGVYATTNALQAGDISTSKFDDYFQYTIAQPVTIHKNESAMVPILQEKLPAERVTLWSASSPTPFRAIWLENTSKLTFDRGSFSIFESGVFAGQGLLDPIHPAEKRLLSYAADQAIRVRVQPQEGKREIRGVHIRALGFVQKRYGVESRVSYEATNSAEEARTVVIEVPRQPNRTLSPDTKPAESAPTLYRFRLPVPAHSSAKQLVSDEGPDFENWNINPDFDQTQALEALSKEVPAIADKLKPILDAQRSIADMKDQLSKLAEKTNNLTGDESRARENLTALKGNDAGKRFVDELNQAEDSLQSTRKETAALAEKEKAAVESLRQLLLTTNIEWQSPGASTIN